MIQVTLIIISKGENMTPKIVDWYLSNIKALVRVYGKVDFDKKELGWILIHYYQLPSCFMQQNSALLLTTPQSDLMGKDGFCFYLNKRLKRNDGKPVTRMHDEDNYNPYKSKGYSRLSFHINNFMPHSDAKKGDNIFDLCESLYYFLGDQRGVI